MRFIKQKMLCGIALWLLPALIVAQNSKVDTVKLSELTRFCAESGADKFLLLHQNQELLRWDAPDCDSIYMNTASMVKSWTGLMIGMLVDEGRIKSVNDKVCKYLPEWEDGCKKEVTIRHLLTMTAGLLKKRASESVLAQENMNDFVLKTKLDTLPEKVFSYSNESVQLLGILIERIYGKSANACFTEKLFKPLGMDSTNLVKDETGNDIMYGGCQTTLEDAAQIGVLISNHGKYNNQQIISQKWIEASLTGTPQAAYYGYLWWVDKSTNSVAAMGDFGQMTIYFPDLDLLFVRQQSCNNADRTKNLNWMGPNFLNLVRSVIKN
jgi:CubicO group peptidase (beta-lactamase class C family)